MSETELGRLMDEVTAQPPVDVRFDAIADRVRQRQGHLRATAAVAAVTALAVIIAVPAAWESSRSRSITGRPAPRPSAATVVDPSWKAQSWGSIHWSQPPSWKVVDTGLGNHSRPSNNGIEGPFLTTEKLRQGCYAESANTGACNRQHVLAHTLPTDGVVVELIGSFSLSGLAATSIPPDDPGTVTPPDATCATWHGSKSFTATKTFGPPDSPHEVQLVGCLGAAVVESASRDLRSVLATMTDSDFNSVPTGASHRVTAGHLGWLLPSTWTATVADPTATVTGRVFTGWCANDPAPGTGSTCDQPEAALHLAPGASLGWISAIESSVVAASAGPTQKYADAPFGQSIPMTPACKGLGGTDLFVVQRHLGPVGGGEFVAVTGCLTDKEQQSQQSELRGILNSVTDAQYPSARDICAAVPAKVEAAALDTVGDIRVLRWGSTQPARDAFPDAKPDEYAAWCWVRDDAHQQFIVYAAHKGDPPVTVVGVHAPTYSGTRPPPSAAPTSLIDSAAPTTAAVAAGTSAEALCTSVLGTVRTAEATTVLDVRTTVEGPGLTPLSAAFPGAHGDDLAAWCWNGVPGNWHAYAVHAGDAPADAGTFQEVGPIDPSEVPPSGPPTAP